MKFKKDKVVKEVHENDVYTIAQLKALGYKAIDEEPTAVVPTKKVSLKAEVDKQLAKKAEEPANDPKSGGSSETKA